MGADEAPLTDVWRDWQPAIGPSTPVEFAAQASAFDYWQITDEAYLEEAWTAMFAMLTEFRAQSRGSYDETFRTLMTVLEGDEGSRRFDVTFVVSRPGAEPMWEGLVARVYRELPDGGAPGVSVLLRRPEGAGDEPAAMTLWLFSGFSEAPSLTVALDRAGANWSARVAPGITLRTPEALADDETLVATVLQETFWRRLVGRNYMESDISRRDAIEPTPGPQPVAAGLELGDRDIEQVFSDSVFAPRLTDFPATN